MEIVSKSILNINSSATVNQLPDYDSALYSSSMVFRTGMVMTVNSVEISPTASVSSEPYNFTQQKDPWMDSISNPQSTINPYFSADCGVKSELLQNDFYSRYQGGTEEQFQAKLNKLDEALSARGVSERESIVASLKAKYSEAQKGSSNPPASEPSKVPNVNDAFIASLKLQAGSPASSSSQSTLLTDSVKNLNLANVKSASSLEPILKEVDSKDSSARIANHAEIVKQIASMPESTEAEKTLKSSLYQEVAKHRVDDPKYAPAMLNALKQGEAESIAKSATSKAALLGQIQDPANKLKFEGITATKLNELTAGKDPETVFYTKANGSIGTVKVGESAAKELKGQDLGELIKKGQVPELANVDANGELRVAVRTVVENNIETRIAANTTKINALESEQKKHDQTIENLRGRISTVEQSKGDFRAKLESDKIAKAKIDAEVKTAIDDPVKKAAESANTKKLANKAWEDSLAGVAKEQDKKLVGAKLDASTFKATFEKAVNKIENDPTLKNDPIERQAALQALVANSDVQSNFKETKGVWLWKEAQAGAQRQDSATSTLLGLKVVAKDGKYITEGYTSSIRSTHSELLSRQATAAANIAAQDKAIVGFAASQAQAEKDIKSYEALKIAQANQISKLRVDNGILEGYKNQLPSADLVRSSAESKEWKDLRSMVENPVDLRLSAAIRGTGVQSDAAIQRSIDSTRDLYTNADFDPQGLTDDDLQAFAEYQNKLNYVDKKNPDGSVVQVLRPHNKNFLKEDGKTIDTDKIAAEAKALSYKYNKFTDGDVQHIEKYIEDMKFSPQQRAVFVQELLKDHKSLEGNDIADNAKDSSTRQRIAIFLRKQGFDFAGGEKGGSILVGGSGGLGVAGSVLPTLQQRQAAEQAVKANNLEAFLKIFQTTTQTLQQSMNMWFQMRSQQAQLAAAQQRGGYNYTGSTRTDAAIASMQRRDAILAAREARMLGRV